MRNGKEFDEQLMNNPVPSMAENRGPLEEETHSSFVNEVHLTQNKAESQKKK